MTTVASQQNFAADVSKILSLLTHYIYTNKDIFLRELISNASDACDKLRYEIIQNSKLSDHLSNLKIKIILDTEAKIIKILDTGIGMTEEEMIENLGKIANSGTQKFLENCGSSSNLELIGKFGVGFYSAFIVADYIKVYSKKVGAPNTFIWESDGKSGYSVSLASEDGDLESNGTLIELKLKEDCLEYLEEYRIRHIIKTYSEYVAFPIELLIPNKSPSILNSSKALWTTNPSSITKEEYKNFYQQISHMPDDPWLTIHNKIEGSLSYINLLFIPTSKPFDLFRPQGKSRVKLYVKKVFIADEGVNIIPSYMRFICGIVDSEDVPLNISRETLQNNIELSKIRKNIVRKVLTALQKKITENIDDYESGFWNNFGEVLKEGLCEGAFEDKELLLDICRFYSLNSPNKSISLSDYITNMVEGQDEIYYIIGDNKDSLVEHPQLQGFKARSIDVLLMTDHVDDFWLQVISQYKNKELKAVLSSNIDLNKIGVDIDTSKEDNSKEESNDDKEIIQYIKNVLKDKVRDVIISTKLVDSPVCLAIPVGAMNIRMEKMLIEQKQLNKRFSKILELNINHPIIKKLANYIKNDQNQAEILVNILFGEACILEGEVIDNPYELIRNINQML